MYITSYSIRIVLLSRYVNIYDTMAPMSVIYYPSCFRNMWLWSTTGETFKIAYIVQTVASKIGLDLLVDPKHLIASITSIDLIKPLGSTSNSYWNELDAIYCRHRGGTMVKWAHLTSQIDQCPTVSKKAGMFSTDSNFCFSTWVWEVVEQSVSQTYFFIPIW